MDFAVINHMGLRGPAYHAGSEFSTGFCWSTRALWVGGMGCLQDKGSKDIHSDQTGAGRAAGAAHPQHGQVPPAQAVVGAQRDGAVGRCAAAHPCGGASAAHRPTDDLPAGHIGLGQGAEDLGTGLVLLCPARRPAGHHTPLELSWRRAHGNVT